jgi:hypothetical protein
MLTSTLPIWQRHILQSPVVEAKMLTFFIIRSFESTSNLALLCSHTDGQTFCSAIPMRVSLKKTIGHVIALAKKLHNFCIDENEAHAPPSCALDEVRTEMQGGIQLEAPTTLEQQHQALVLKNSFHVN